MTKTNGKTRKGLLALERDLNSSFHERGEEVRGILWGMLTPGGANVLFLGPPGSGKSLLIRHASKAINGRYFETLLHPASTPEQVFGGYNPSRMMDNGEFVHNTHGMLPASEIGFIDEPFKCNAATLNSMLQLMNERTFSNGPNLEDTDILYVAGGANELPEEEDLAALYDRFVLRFWVDYIRDERSLMGLLVSGTPEPPTSKVTTDDVRAARDEVGAVKVGKVAQDAIMKIKQAFEAESIRLSTRRWVQAIGVMKAEAWLNGRKEITDEDLIALTAMAWDDPAERAKVAKLVNRIANPLNERALEFQDAAKSLVDEATKKGPDEAEHQWAVRLAKASRQLKDVVTRIDHILKDNPNGRASKLREVRTTIAGYQTQIGQRAAELLGV